MTVPNAYSKFCMECESTHPVASNKDDEIIAGPFSPFVPVEIETDEGLARAVTSFKISFAIGCAILSAQLVHAQLYKSAPMMIALLNITFIFILCGAAVLTTRYGCAKTALNLYILVALALMLWLLQVFFVRLGFFVMNASGASRTIAESEPIDWELDLVVSMTVAFIVIAWSYVCYAGLALKYAWVGVHARQALEYQRRFLKDSMARLNRSQPREAEQSCESSIV